MPDLASRSDASTSWVLLPIDDGAVRRKPTVGDAEHELRAHHPLDVDAVDHVLHRRQHLARELELAQPQGATLAGRAEPAQKKSEQLPQRVEPEAAGHDRIAFEMTGKKPHVGLDAELGADQPLAML